MTTMKGLREWTRRYADDTLVAYSLWLEEDVKSIEDEMEISLSDEQRKTIMDDIHRGYDATKGINWGIIMKHVYAMRE